MTHFLRLLLLLTLLSLAACTTFHHTPPVSQSTDGTLIETRYHAEVQTADGSRIRMTVYQPRLKAGQRAPLLIHAHGYSLGRMARPLSIYGQLLIAGQVSLQMWHQGYWVISYDQRGQGDSEGHVSMMDADKEPKDVSSIIDWAQANLAISQQDGSAQIGMIGESYGAGVQMSATVQEPRIKVLVPLTGWYDLDAALFPNGVPKTDWLSFLGLISYTRMPLHMDNAMAKGTLKEIFASGDPALHRRLSQNSLAAHCGASEGPHADALLVQGVRDVLFPFNQALDARTCFLQHGRDVRLIAVEHGHLMLGSQFSPGLSMPLWHMQARVRCDGQIYQTASIIQDWLNGKLQGDAAALARVPRYCVSGDAAIDATPPVLTGYSLAVAGSHDGASGWFEFFARPLQGMGNLFRRSCSPTAPDAGSACPDWKKASDGWLRPAIIPITAVDQPTWIVGVPKVKLIVNAANRKNATVFLRLAVWRPHLGSYRILSEQVTPVRADGTLTFELNAVRDKLQVGEVIGLLIQGHSDQFRLGGSGLTTRMTLSGQIGLPLAPAADASAYEADLQ
jgi:ABC-2 type transport system ATP-binding protein